MKEEKISREELIGILGVTNGALKQIIRRNQLYDRLLEKGYKYIDKIKEGRNVKYIVNKISDDKKILNDITVNMFGTRNDKDFGDYVLYRLYNLSKPITNKMLSEWCNVNRNTISKWDDEMIRNGFMTKDGYFYMAIDYDNKNKPTYRLTTKHEYISYLKCSKYANKKREIAERYKRSEISYDEMEIAIEGINEFAKTIEKKFVYRINKFQLVKNNYLFVELVTLIENTRTDNKVYYKDWLPSIN